MDPSSGEEPPRIDATLDPIRAAISLVADGLASLVTVQVPEASQVMPAVRQLARAAGVSVELVDAPERMVALPDVRESA
jgi:hypothetical protein